MSELSLDCREPADGEDPSGPRLIERLDVSIAVTADDAVVRAVGGLDGPGGRQLHTVGEQLIEARCRRVVLDLSAITSADIPGVRALVELGVMLERAGIEQTIRDANTATYPVDWRAIPHSQEY
jgi:anti-anti-sigma regulatory factor